MKIWYEFTNGEVSEIEVGEALGGLLVEFDRQEYNNDHKETRRHVSLNGLDYEGALFASPDDPAAEVLRRKCCGGRTRPGSCGLWRPCPPPSGSWC